MYQHCSGKHIKSRPLQHLSSSIQTSTEASTRNKASEHHANMKFSTVLYIVGMSKYVTFKIPRSDFHANGGLASQLLKRKRLPAPPALLAQASLPSRCLASRADLSRPSAWDPVLLDQRFLLAHLYRRSSPLAHLVAVVLRGHLPQSFFPRVPAVPQSQPDRLHREYSFRFTIDILDKVLSTILRTL
jgi:hypothetical protein